MTLALEGLPAPPPVEFKVVGEPRAQGSKVGRVVWPKTGGKPFAIVHDVEAPQLKAWRRAIAVVAASIRGSRADLPFTGPVAVAVAFSVRAPRVIPPERRGLPAVSAPGVADADKLLRAALDALTTAQLYVDDAQVCHAQATKVYCGGPPPALPQPGARFRVLALSEAEYLPHAAHDLSRWLGQ